MSSVRSSHWPCEVRHTSPPQEGLSVLHRLGASNSGGPVPDNAVGRKRNAVVRFLSRRAQRARAWPSSDLERLDSVSGACCTNGRVCLIESQRSGWLYCRIGYSQSGKVGWRSSRHSRGGVWFSFRSVLALHRRPQFSQARACGCDKGTARSVQLLNTRILANLLCYAEQLARRQHSLSHHPRKVPARLQYAIVVGRLCGSSIGSRAERDSIKLKRIRSS